MKVLVWNAPWAVQGDLLFFKNCYLKHLLLQANCLVHSKIDVDLFTNDYIHDDSASLDSRVSLINISAHEIMGLTSGISNPMATLYEGTNQSFVEKIKTFLRPKLAAEYDVILLWENPVPFLEEMYPGAIVIHQMPGVFSRAPFPAMVTFDVKGLYKDGAIHSFSNEIYTADSLGTSDLRSHFTSAIKDAYQKLPAIHERDIRELPFEKVALLPLQVSNHYAFQVDTEYKSQTDYLLDVLTKTDPNTAVLATQYVTPNISDTVITPNNYATLKKQWPNLYYNFEFEKHSSISQHLITHAHKVITCSSSMGIQAMLWPKEIEIYGDTFLKNYGDTYLNENQIDIEKTQKNLIGFILNKQQILTTKVVHDWQFLARLLEELVYIKQKNGSKLDSFVNFCDIDDNYPDQLINAISVPKASKALRAQNPVLDAEILTCEKFERAIRNNDIQTISFDVFDTLIARPVEVPSDAYQFLEFEALKISNGTTEDFSRVRLTAEVETRNNSSAGEITLDEIYAFIESHYQLPHDLINTIKLREIEMEIDLIERRELGFKLWNIAKESRKPITIISDMYLPHYVVEKMLIKAGFVDYKKLYVSSDYGTRKKEGPLFDIVIKDQDLVPEKHLHIGDNKQADVERAQERGMFAFRIPRAIDRMRSNPSYTKIFNPRSGVGQKSRSVIAGLIAHRFFDMPSGALEQESLFMGNPHRLGYAAIGPLLTAYMLWLSKRAKADKISKLYFLSREGWILKEIYDALNAKNKDVVPSAYLYCSRRAARVAALTSLSDITAVASQPFEAGVRIKSLLLSRFGLENTPEIDEITKQSIFGDTDHILASDAASRVAFSKLCVALSEHILAHAKIERAAYMDYLNESGLVSEASPALIDIGWKANMQGSLGALIKRPLHGYYYATLQGVERWALQGHTITAFAGDSLSLAHNSAPVNNRHISEFLTCKADGSLINFYRNGNGKLTPRLRHDLNAGTRNLLIQEVHRGAIDFAADLAHRFHGHTEHLVLDPQLAEQVYKHFIEQPLLPDAQLLSGQFFEDAFGGIDKKFIIADNKNGVSVWKKGAAIIYPAAPAAPKPKTVKPAHPPTANTVATPAKESQSAPLPKQPTIGEMRKSRVTGIQGFFILPVEKLIIRFIVAQKKFEKYKKNRNAFFEDSKDKLAVRWYSFTNPEI